MKKLGILFDYNGVIADDEHLQEASMAAAVRPYGVELTHGLYFAQCVGRSDATGFRNIQKVFPSLLQVDITELIEDKAQAYQKLIEHESVLHPAIKAVLAEFAGTFTMAVVTGSLRAEVEPILKEANIFDLFVRVITADEITQGKPNPEGYLKGIAALELPLSDIVVVEDTQPGIQAAHAAGLKCIAVAHTMDKAQLQQADLVLPDISHLNAAVIKKVLK